MEAEERPAKLRKLNSNDDTGSDEDTGTPLLSKLPGTTNGAADAPLSQNSKPEEEYTANIEDSSVKRQHGGEFIPDESEGLDVSSGTLPDDTHTLPALQHPQDGDLQKPLSKNQLKKLRKQQEWEAARDYRKAKRKQKTQEKKARKRAAREEEEQHGLQTLQRSPAGEGGDGEVDGTKMKTMPNPPQVPPKMKHRRSIQVPVTILIDCGFDDLMLDKERISLGSQLTRSYSDNSRSRYRAHLVISSWGGLLKKRFDTVLNKHYLNWRNVTFVEGDFVEAAKKADELMKGPGGGNLVGCFEKYAAAAAAPQAGAGGPVSAVQGETSNVANGSAPSARPDKVEATDAADGTPSDQQPSGPKDPQPTQPQIPLSSPRTDPSAPPPGEVIYLTSDSPDTLTTLSPYSTYIVGGLVDKNRHKGICYKTARERGIKTAKLPIGEYLEMTSRKVLATNHVVEILLRYLEEEDWGKAFLRVIPKRKGGRLRGENAGGGEGEGDDNENDEGDEHEQNGVSAQVENDADADNDADDGGIDTAEDAGDQ
ncbi:hypothetical protein Z517_11905 [Fonsecaea pedrosoi CBS 271.37]|uniref:tRNA (guanine(9)-N1)-methyltransferase n=1 Tax=Fonsecaea pedrosoi CBS 271.37 TaxID=1442368 RepID=A0A0D2G2Z1_9EURO|nr:uncharacterized protein Z517_11905 [Fonsecaea pedrosoi CBS 271.37]KIW75133.1 hypothetical protein Z517_11905 [Fonsecaea pedrosoi CBS 271.37]